LYTVQGRNDLALAIYLRLRRHSVFDFVEAHGLASALADHVVALIEIDEARALSLLVEHHEEVAPSAVVPPLQVQGAPSARRRCQQCHARSSSIE
jgi:vacuolar protein sorting-associated protein 41